VVFCKVIPKLFNSDGLLWFALRPQQRNEFPKCSNAAVLPVDDRRYSKSFSLIDCISVGVDRIQRNSEPLRKQVEAWQRSELTDVTAKVVIYEAFVEGRRKLPNILPAPCMTFTSYVAQRFMWRPLGKHIKTGRSRQTSAT
jgi:hypothetical protein